MPISIASSKNLEIFCPNKMKEFWILIFVALLATNLLDKAKSVKVKLEETPLKTFEEIFGEGWWDKSEAEDLKMPPSTNFGQNVQIDRQNTQFGQIEPNSTDQNPPLTESDHPGQSESNSTDQNPSLTKSDHSGQIEPNSSYQNPPITESDHSDNAKNGEEQKEIIKTISSNEKRKIIDKFHSIKDKFKQKRKFSPKEWLQIEEKIAKHLKVNRAKIYKWKKEFGLSRKVFYEKEERKHLVEKFDQMKAKLKRDGFKILNKNEIDKTVAKELGLSFRTIYNWKRELGLTRTNYSVDEKLKIVKKLMRLKSGHSGKDKKSCKEIDKEIAEKFGVNVRTITQWKKEFGLSRKVSYEKEERKHLIEQFDQKKAELKRTGFKNSQNGLDKTVAKELGLNYVTIYRWKSKLGQPTSNKHSYSKQKKLMQRYYEINDKNPKIHEKEIAKMLKIGSATLIRWKKQLKQQQLHPNSGVGHFVEENAAANVQEIENLNSESI